MSALALAYATSGDEEYKTKLDYMVSAMKECQDKAQGKPEEFTTQCTPSSAAQSRWSTDPSTWGRLLKCLFTGSIRITGAVYTICNYLGTILYIT